MHNGRPGFAILRRFYSRVTTMKKYAKNKEIFSITKLNTEQFRLWLDAGKVYNCEKYVLDYAEKCKLLGNPHFTAQNVALFLGHKSAQYCFTVCLELWKNGTLERLGANIFRKGN